MEPKTQPQTMRQKFDEFIDKELFNAATKEELQGVIDVFIEKYRDLQANLTKRVDDSDAEMKKSVERLGKEGAEMEKRLRDIVNKKEQTLAQKIDELRVALTTDIDAVESMIEYYNDEEVREMLNTLNTRFDNLEIPEQFDATELTEKVDKNTEDIEDLKKRPVGTGGGRVTDRAVQYALMRVIQKETPTGTIDGANDTFTVSSTIHTVLGFELGSRVISLGTYSITGSARKTIVFDNPIPANYSDDSFIITYV